MKKFSNKYKTADGSDRAFVQLKHLETLWFNTGTLCNIECANCYIESSPSNDKLVYLTTADIRPFLHEIEQGLNTTQLGFTGGEPFMNPDMIDILTLGLEKNFEILILTNAMQPLMRPKVQQGLEQILKTFGVKKIIMRVSLDSYEEARHNEERGAGAFAKTLEGLKWLSDRGFRIHIAGRKWSDEPDEVVNAHYQTLLGKHNIKLDDQSATPIVCFPEMDDSLDLPEITTKCWDVLSVNPNDIMCASSRMVVKHKGQKAPSLTACTLLPYEKEFNLGATLKEAAQPVYLNHRHCAKFCVLGGSSCA